jgi:hypothetical protein
MQGAHKIAVGIENVFLVALAFGSYPKHERWNPQFDINEDGYVGIDDLFMVASSFGREPA